MTTIASLAPLELWVGWKRETRNGRPTKTPYDPRTGLLAATDNPATWATRDEARWWTATNGAAGVGLVLGVTGDECICGTDLDCCRDKATGALTAWAKEVIDRLATYTEISPSETGVKLFFVVASADLPAVEAVFGGQFGRVFKNGSGEHPPSIEVYRGRRYFVVTEDSCGETDDLRQVSVEDLEWLIRDHGPKFAGKGKKANGAGKRRQPLGQGLPRRRQAQGGRILLRGNARRAAQARRPGNRRVGGDQGTGQRRARAEARLRPSRNRRWRRPASGLRRVHAVVRLCLHARRRLLAGGAGSTPGLRPSR